MKSLFYFQSIFNENSKMITLIMLLFFAPATMAAGILKPTNSNLETLEIRKHQVKVTVEDGYAITEVNQVFYNSHNTDLEANYSFPVPEKAAVAEFTMWIDGKPVTGEVMEKSQARRVYEEEKQAGRDAGLTEKNSFKTFEIFVTPVRARQDMQIRVVYIQPTHVDTGIGRYVYPLEDGGVDTQTQKFWSSSSSVKENFSFDLKVRSSYPIDSIRVPDYGSANISKISQNEWQVSMSKTNIPAYAEETSGGESTTNNTVSQAYTLDKDIVVYWKHVEGLPAHVDLVTYRPENSSRGTFLLSMTPGDDLSPIHEGKDWIFVLDISGSMLGKYESLAEGVQRALKKMRSNDRFRIVTFNSDVSEMTDGFINATPENISYYAGKVASVAPSSGTNLFGGLAMGIDTIEANRSTGIILVTDGVANVGETHQRKFLELIDQKDIRLFTFVMGNSANRPLLNAITRASGGFAMNISNSDDVVGKIMLAADKLTHSAFHGISLDIKGVKTTNISPRNLGSLYRGQQLLVFGHYWESGEAVITLRGRISGESKQYRTRIQFPETSTDNPELERLWAFSMIEDFKSEMEDFGEKDDLKQAVTDIAVQYGLVTNYTSMVILREDVFTARNIDRNNDQRLKAERSAQQVRASQPVQNRRADSGQPMFSGNSSSLGGGSMNLIFCGLIVVLIGIRRVMIKKSVQI